VFSLLLIRFYSIEMGPDFLWLQRGLIIDIGSLKVTRRQETLNGLRSVGKGSREGIQSGRESIWSPGPHTLNKKDFQLTAWKRPDIPITDWANLFDYVRKGGKKTSKGKEDYLEAFSR